MKLDWKTCLRVALCAFLLFLGIHYLPTVESLFGAILGALAPLFTGIVIAYVLNILMRFYERHYFTRFQNTWIVRKSRRVVCLLAAILTLLGILALVVWLVIPELISCLSILISEVPPAVEKLLQSAPVADLLPEDLLAYLQQIDWQSSLTKVVNFLVTGLGDAANIVIGAVTSVLSGTVTLVIGIIFAIYLLMNKNTLLNQANRLANTYLRPNWTQKLRYWLQVFHDSFRRYIVGQCTEAVILGCLCIVGMLIFRFPYAVMIGALIGVTALIPIAGAYIGAIVGALMILTVSPIQSLLFLVFILVLQQLEGNLLYPKVVGNSLGLPAIWVLTAVTIGSSLMGISGMLLGVPITAALYRLLKEDVHRREGSAPAADLSLLHETVAKHTGTKKK